jgi:hypothetical protein
LHGPRGLNCILHLAAIVFPLIIHGIFSAEDLLIMPRGDKSSYSAKQKRRAEHIERSYEKRGTKPKEAKRRAWATVNKMTGGGKRSGSGRGKKINLSPTRKGGRIGGRARARK